LRAGWLRMLSYRPKRSVATPWQTNWDWRLAICRMITEHIAGFALKSSEVAKESLFRIVPCHGGGGAIAILVGIVCRESPVTGCYPIDQPSQLADR